MDEVVQFLAKATEEIASSYCLQNTTTSKEIDECKGILERSIAAHPELLLLKPEELHRDHLARYDELTANMTTEQKNVFTIDLYNSMVEASIGAMRLLLQVTSPPEKTLEENEDDEEVVVTREDLVTDHVGSTEKKTIDFLEANRGKVILVDEAYICHNDKDLYGEEALKTLNKWLKDHPEEKLYRME